jgi:hypothetical protein
MRQVTPSSPIPVHLVGGGFPWGTVGSIVAAVVVGFGAAFLGGWLQQRAGTKVARNQIQVQAAVNFMNAHSKFTQSIAAFTVLPRDPSRVRAQALDVTENLAELRSALLVMEMVGPDGLHEKAQVAFDGCMLMGLQMNDFRDARLATGETGAAETRLLSEASDHYGAFQEESKKQLRIR